jgi:tetratricopeptide (TPR) repeat protein
MKIGVYSEMSKDSLLKLIKTKDDIERAVILFLIASKDDSPSKYTTKAFQLINSNYNKNPSAFNTMLLGSVYSLMARDEKSEMVAAKNVQNALDYLNKAVKMEPQNSIIREFRTHCFVGIPDVFNIKEGLEEDEIFYEKEIGSDSSVNKIPTMMTLASVYFKTGDLVKASALWNKVISLTDKDNAWNQSARKMLSEIDE